MNKREEEGEEKRRGWNVLESQVTRSNQNSTSTNYILRGLADTIEIKSNNLLPASGTI